MGSEWLDMSVESPHTIEIASATSIGIFILITTEYEW